MLWTIVGKEPAKSLAGPAPLLPALLSYSSTLAIWLQRCYMPGRMDSRPLCDALSGFLVYFFPDSDLFLLLSRYPREGDLPLGRTAGAQLCPGPHFPEMLPLVSILTTEAPTFPAPPGNSVPPRALPESRAGTSRIHPIVVPLALYREISRSAPDGAGLPCRLPNRLRVAEVLPG